MTTPQHTDNESPNVVEPRVPWYSLNPRHLSRSRLMRALLIGLLIATISIVPLWRFLWYIPVYSARNLLPVRDVRGRFHSPTEWVRGKEIRIYQLPDVRNGSDEIIASGVRELVHDAGLDFTVKVMPMPADVRQAWTDSLVEKDVYGVKRPCVAFGKLEARLLAHRKGAYAEMLIVNSPLSDAVWAHGMAVYNSGVSVLVEDHVSLHLGKHESGHLLGYMYHDSLPLYVIGYPWEGFPWSRDTLMVLYGHSNEMSPRTRDALRYFWRGMEHRSKMKFLVK